MKIHNKAIVIHSGGMDSSICLAFAVKEHGSNNVLSLSFRYGQIHSNELEQAQKIAKHFGVENTCVQVDCFKKLTHSALLDPNIEIVHEKGKAPSTIVVGRNGFMMRMAAIYGDDIGIEKVYTGIIEVDGSNSGYRDCSRRYADMMQEVLRLDLNNPCFEIITPLVFMSKKQTMDFAYQLGVLEYLLEETITCYRGVPREGCGTCPACSLRNEGIAGFLEENPGFNFSYKDKIMASR